MRENTHTITVILTMKMFGGASRFQLKIKATFLTGGARYNYWHKLNSFTSHSCAMGKKRKHEKEDLSTSKRKKKIDVPYFDEFNNKLSKIERKSLKKKLKLDLLDDEAETSWSNSSSSSPNLSPNISLTHPSAYTEEFFPSNLPFSSSSTFSTKASRSIDKGAIIPQKVNSDKNAARLERFTREALNSPHNSPPPPKLSKKKAGQGFGRSTNLDKQYLRITGKVKVEDTRPEKVLMKALKYQKKRFLAEEIDYEAFSEQMKSIRQDLTVQSIENDFAVQVYVCHARVAIEEGDLNEFNQCQSILSGKLNFTSGEFKAYRILYSLIQKKVNELTDIDVDPSDNDNDNANYNDDDNDNDAVAHARKIVIAVSTSNYNQFFQLYQNAPHLCVYLEDFLVLRMRNMAYSRFLASYMTLGLDFIFRTLCFSDRPEMLEFISQHGGIVDVKQSVLLCKVKKT